MSMRVVCERYAKSIYSKRIITALLCYKNRSLACRDLLLQSAYICVPRLSLGASWQPTSISKFLTIKWKFALSLFVCLCRIISVFTQLKRLRIDSEMRAYHYSIGRPIHQIWTLLNMFGRSWKRLSINVIQSWLIWVKVRPIYLL